MIISDLSILEVAQENNVVGGFNFGNSSATTTNFTLGVNEAIISSVKLKGNQAGSEADATATGKNTITTTVTGTNVVQGQSSASTATSISATSGSYYGGYGW